MTLDMSAYYNIDAQPPRNHLLLGVF